MDVAGGLPLLQGAQEGGHQSHADYLKVVRRYADALIEHGRDRYGKQHSPLFAAALDRPLFPGALGHAIFNLLAAYRITGEDKYRERGTHFGDMAVDLFFTDASPLPKASSQHDHYEAITRADTLMMAFLKLWNVHNRPDRPLDVEYADR